MQIYQKQARRRTDAQIAQITNQILDTYRESLKSIDAELQALYAKHLVGVDPANYYNEAIKFERLTKLKAQVTAQYTAASVKAGRLIKSASETAMVESYYQNQFIMDFFTPTAGVNLSFTLIPPELVELSITGNIDKWKELDAKLKARIQAKYGPVVEYVPKDGQTLTALLAANRRQDIQKLNRVITSGLLQGKSYRDTARDVKKVIGSVSKGKASGAMANAIRIVRTESNRTYNAGNYANTQAAVAQGIEIKRIYLATLDTRTRPQSGSMDGQTVGADEPFTFPNGATALYPGNSGVAAYDINDRCDVLTAVDGIPPSARRGVNPVTGESDVFDWTTYDDWKKEFGV